MGKIQVDSRSIYAEAYRTIKTNIRYSITDMNKKIILISSAEAGDGKTTTACNLAVSISEEKKKVLIIDCDLRNPSVHKYFEISGLLGLSEYLIGEDNLKAVTKEFNGYLDIIPSGKMPPNPIELLSSINLDELFKELKVKYDYIIIDSPPLGIIADSQILASKVDGTVLVAMQGKTKKQKLLGAKGIVDKVGGKTIGVILNKVTDGFDSYYAY